MSLNGFLAAVLQATNTKAMDLGTAKEEPAYTARIEFAHGTGSGQADLIFADQRTIANSSSEELDLSGTLKNAFGDNQAFVKIKGLLIKNLSPTQTLTIGGAASNAWAAWAGAANDVVKIGPGGWHVFGEPAGFAVTAGTGDLLKIANGAAGDPADYIIAIIGTSA
jgi:hypothetical protein